jgi:hypothetical protein
MGTIERGEPLSEYIELDSRVILVIVMVCDLLSSFEPTSIPASSPAVIYNDIYATFELSSPTFKGLCSR